MIKIDRLNLTGRLDSDEVTLAARPLKSSWPDEDLTSAVRACCSNSALHSTLHFEMHDGQMQLNWDRTERNQKGKKWQEKREQLKEVRNNKCWRKLV